MKANVTVVVVGVLGFTRIRFQTPLPTRSPHCAEGNNTIQPTERLLVFAACENVAFCLCVDLIDSLGICRNFVGISLDCVPELTIQLTEPFFDESSLLNFLLVFAMREIVAFCSCFG